MLYGSSYSFLNSFLSRYGVTVDFINLNDIALLREKIRVNTRLIYFETPCNPTLDIIDIAQVCSVSHEHDIKVVVDNTFLTPFFQKPIECGADIVVHSMTKYLNGHGDALGGIALSVNMDYLKELKFNFMCELGSQMDPNSAFLILRGLKTLAIRMEEHQWNAMTVANYLRTCEKVRKIYYPGLSAHNWPLSVQKQMKGFGAMVAFELDSDIDSTQQFIESMKRIKLGVSLGDCETLIEHPLSMTHRSYLNSPGSLIYKKLQSLVRVSVGLEDVDSIIEDIDQAMQKL